MPSRTHASPLGVIVLALLLILATWAEASVAELQVFGGPEQPNVGIPDGHTNPSLTNGTDLGKFGIEETGFASQTFLFRIDPESRIDEVRITNITTGNARFGVQPPQGLSYPITVTPGRGILFDVIFLKEDQTGIEEATIRIITGKTADFVYDFTVRAQMVAGPRVRITGENKTIPNGSTVIGDVIGTDLGRGPVGSLLRGFNFRIFNSGTASLQASVAFDDDRFSAFGLNTPVSPGRNDRFGLQLNPDRSGTFQSTVTFTTNDPLNPTYDFLIQGVAVAPEFQLKGLGNRTIQSGDTTPSTVDGTNLGGATMGEETTQTFTIRNRASAVAGDPTTWTDLEVTEIQINANQFQVVSGDVPSGGSLIIPAGGSHSFVVGYTPDAIGAQETNVLIFHNDPDDDENPMSFRLRGTGEAFVGDPQLEIGRQIGTPIPNGDTMPSTAENTLFPTATVGIGSVNRGLTLRNIGTNLLDVTSATVDSPAFQLINFLGTLAPGASRKVSMRFRPTEPGVYLATVTLRSNDPDDDPFTYQIFGDAIAPSAGPFRITEVVVVGEDASITFQSRFGYHYRAYWVELGSAPQQIPGIEAIQGDNTEITVVLPLPPTASDRHFFSIEQVPND